MTNPEFLSRKQTPYGTPLTEQKGGISVTLPFIINSIKGYKYGFIFRTSDGLLQIYRQEENDWIEYARVEIASVN
jgi:hypothetical protein